MNRNRSSIFWGLLIIVVGVLFLGNSLDLWNINIFFAGWWTLFIFVFSVYGLFKKEWISSLLGISIATILLLASQRIIEWSMVGKLFIPCLLIIIGLSILFKPKVKRKVSTESKTEYVGVFSSNEALITDKFNDSSLVAVFGGVDLDLREAVIEDDIVIDCVSVFGGIDIKLPKDVNVKVSGVPIFGGIENNYQSSKKDGKTVTINYVCIFAGIDLK